MEAYNPTARQVVAMLQSLNPCTRYAVNSGKDICYYDESAIAVWHENTWVMVLGKIITGGWTEIPNLLVDGVPVISSWTEVHREIPS